MLARRLPPDELYDWFERLRLRGGTPTGSPTPSRWRRACASSSRGTDEPAALRALVGAARSRRGAPGHGRRGEEVRDGLERYFEELRDVRLEISGGDLAELGLAESPRVGVVLDEVLRRKLNGELDGRAAELEAARELLQRS